MSADKIKAPNPTADRAYRYSYRQPGSEAAELPAVKDTKALFLCVPNRIDC